MTGSKMEAGERDGAGPMLGRATGAAGGVAGV
jgi:hypothetical protein